MKARIKFRKYGVMRFIGHLDVMRYFQKVMRRAQIPIAFTGGYSPHMIMSFAQPLGVGITSDGEYMDIELRKPVSSATAVKQMNAVMAEGIDIVSLKEIPDEKKASGMTITAAASYRVTLLASEKSAEVTRPVPDEWQALIGEFLARAQIPVIKKTKRSEAEVDIRPMIYEMHADGEGIFLFLAAGSERNLKPELVMDAFLDYINKSPKDHPLHVHRLDIYARNREIPDDSPEAHVRDRGLVTLESLGKDIP